jgi:hypothetical protein
LWAAFFRWCCFWRPPCLYRRVIVNFTADPSEALEGVLWSYRWRWLTLTDVSALKGGATPEKIIGDAVLHRTQIKFLQVLP